MSDRRRYRIKNPAVITATQFWPKNDGTSGDPRIEAKATTGWGFSEGRNLTVVQYFLSVGGARMRIEPGDWLVTKDGSREPEVMSDVRFRDKYEVAE